MSVSTYPARVVTAKLEQGARLEAAGCSMARICQVLQVSELTYLRWRRKYGDLDQQASSRLDRLEQENMRLRRTVEQIEVLLEGLRCSAEALDE